MSTQTAQVFQTPDEIAYYRFASLKFALGIERAGMKMRGGAVRPQLAAEFGLKPRDPHTAYIAYCETQMALLLAKRTFPQVRSDIDPQGKIPRTPEGNIDWD